MVEMKVTVDDDVNVGRAQIMLGERVSRVPVHDLPLLDQLRRPAHAGVDQNGSGARMFDDEAVNWTVVQLADACEVEPNDLH